MKGFTLQKTVPKWTPCYHAWLTHPLTHAGYKSSDTKHFGIELDSAVQSHVSAHAADSSHLLSMTAVTHVGDLVFLPWLGYPHASSPWWHSHTVMWQNPYLPNRRWLGHCRTVSHVWEGEVLGTTLVSLGKNSAREALACLCCRCFPFTQPNRIILLSTEL